MWPQEANGDTGRSTAGPDDLRARAAPAGPRSRLPTRAPLESDRQLVLASSLEDVAAILSGPAAMATWFSVTREPTDSAGRVVVGLPHTATVLHGHETWMSDQHALIFDGDHPAVSGFAQLRSVILPVGGFGTEVLVHVEVPRGRGARHHLTTLEQVVNQGLTRIHAELDRSPR